MMTKLFSGRRNKFRKKTREIRRTSKTNQTRKTSKCSKHLSPKFGKVIIFCFRVIFIRDSFESFFLRRQGFVGLTFDHKGRMKERE